MNAAPFPSPPPIPLGAALDALPALSPLLEVLRRIHARYATLDGGEVASYIPELTKADPSWFGIAIATTDGHVYEVGDSRQTFTIQSVSKPLVYGMALEDRGRERVLQAVGVEPTGEAFNSISLEPGTGRPLNPMINAGAIASSGLIAGDDAAARLARVVGGMSTYAGRTLDIDEDVYRSERDTGHRNRAIGHLLRNYDVLTEDPEAALDLYFRQCAVRVDCRDLALIAATLANGGVQPVTGAQAIPTEHVEQVLSVMTSCGVYDFAGEWLCRVGMPAKSGVGGGIMAVLPGQLGIGVFSPKLDARGNSVRGVQVCEALSSELALHFLHPPRPAAAVVRASYDLATRRSKRRRPPAHVAALDRDGALARVVELQGDLRFSAVERIAREIVTPARRASVALLDFKRVTLVDATTIDLFAGLVHQARAGRIRLVFSRVADPALRAALAAAAQRSAVVDAEDGDLCSELDRALERCEELLLADDPSTIPLPISTTLVEHRLCRGLSPADVALLDAVAGHGEARLGELLVRRGDAADTLYFLTRGEVSVQVPLPNGERRRLSTLSAGMGFGETALIDGGFRGADVHADTAVEYRTLKAADFERLRREHPSLALGLLHNLLRTATETAARLTTEIAALEG